MKRLVSLLILAGAILALAPTAASAAQPPPDLVPGGITERNCPGDQVVFGTPTADYFFRNQKKVTLTRGTSTMANWAEEPTNITFVTPSRPRLDRVVINMTCVPGRVQPPPPPEPNIEVPIVVDLVENEIQAWSCPAGYIIDGYSTTDFSFDPELQAHAQWGTVSGWEGFTSYQFFALGGDVEEQSIDVHCRLVPAEPSPHTTIVLQVAVVLAQGESVDIHCPTGWRSQGWFFDGLDPDADVTFVGTGWGIYNPIVAARGDVAMVFAYQCTNLPIV